MSQIDPDQSVFIEADGEEIVLHENVDELFGDDYDIDIGKNDSVHVVSIVNRSDSRPNLVYGKKDDSGWSFEVLIQGRKFLSKCRIGVDPEDKVHIFYYDKTLKMIKHIERIGQEWVFETVIEDIEIVYTINFDLSNNGNIDLICCDDSGEEGIYRIFKYGTLWKNYRINEYGHESDIAISSNNSLHLVYSKPIYSRLKNFRYGFKNGTGTDFSTIELLNSSKYEDVLHWWNPDLIIDKQGNPCISIRGSSSNNYSSKILIIKLIQGKWELIMESKWMWIYSRPQLFCDSSNNLILFYLFSDTSGHTTPEIFSVSNSNVSRTMITDIDMQNAQGTMDGNGRIHLLYKSKNEQMMYLRDGKQTVPDPPENVNVIKEGDAVRVKWSSPAFDGGYRIEYYSVYRMINGSHLEKLYNTKGSGKNHSFIDWNVVQGKQLSYFITATNLKGESDRSSSVNISIFYPPDPPKSFYFTKGEDWVHLFWSTPENDGGSSLTGYNITILDHHNFVQDIIEIGPYENDVNLSFEKGTQLTFNITAKNALGESKDRQGFDVIVGLTTPPPILDSVDQLADIYIIHFTVPISPGVEYEYFNIVYHVGPYINGKKYVDFIEGIYNYNHCLSVKSTTPQVIGVV